MKVLLSIFHSLRVVQQSSYVEGWLISQGFDQSTTRYYFNVYKYIYETNYEMNPPLHALILISLIIRECFHITENEDNCVLFLLCSRNLNHF